MMTKTNFYEKKNLKYRHEIKYQINFAEYFILKERLKKVFKTDIYAAPHGYYHVNSIYFDTPYDKALYEKINGTDKREKYRIRFYNQNMDYIKLERKIKENRLTSKQSSLLSYEETKKILLKDNDFLLYSNNPLLIELYSKIKGQGLMPKNIVTYRREAFIYSPSNVRITLDSEIQSKKISAESKCFYEKYNYIKTFNNKFILEVKYDNFLPEIVKIMLSTLDKLPISFSKYASSRIYE
ncbi:MULTISPECIES: polyphosphate polymerase domain-containing protein [Anaerofustis]|uniref:polyphosphate polymerase domain-containing protein n=1 Tax=Anaerofustis TaxID=264995 RepID=UPI001FAA5D80|nr:MULTISPECIES: polyphosphate polymerase domain-containing protein [Anaerofustis]MCO8192992.1 polyphosphate polymerase domain-containing protein [Anaerofustis sp. NSJ-163]